MACSKWQFTLETSFNCTALIPPINDYIMSINRQQIIQNFGVQIQNLSFYFENLDDLIKCFVDSLFSYLWS